MISRVTLSAVTTAKRCSAEVATSKLCLTTRLVLEPGYEGTRVLDPGYEGIRSGVRGY